MIAAIGKGDIKFITDTTIPTIGTIEGGDLILASIFKRSNLDWIFDFNPEWLGTKAFKQEIDYISCFDDPSYALLLKYLFKRSEEKKLPSYELLANYAKMAEHGLKIPEFPGEE